MEEFFQKTLFLKKRFIFKENGVDIEFSDRDGDFSMFIGFDRIASRNNVRINTKRKRLVLRYGLLAAALILARGLLTINTDFKTTIVVIALAVFIAGGAYAYYYFTQLKYYSVGLEDKKIFMVIYNKPSIAEAKEFLDELFERRKQYYRDEYFYINYENTKKSEADKMKWLRSEDVISDNEFNVVIDEINANVHD